MCAIANAAQVAAPVFTPVSGPFIDTLKITLTASGADAVYYTLNGAIPTTSSTKYAGPITITASSIVKAKSVKKSFTDSAIVTASYTMVPPAKDFLNAFNWSGGSRRWEQFASGATLWITSDPIMPYIYTQDTVTGGLIQPSTTLWQFRSQYLFKSSRSQDTRSFPNSGFIGIPYGQPWQISRDYFSGSDFFGGEISINFADNINTSVKRFYFKIGGLNPTTASIRSYLSSLGAPSYFSAMLELESGLRQFYTTGASVGEPVFGGPDGWGMAQIDRFSSGATASTMEVWNWRNNLYSGVAILNNKKQDASNYFSYIKSTYPAQWEEPPATYTDKRTHTSLSYQDAATITLYNGASVIVRANNGVYYHSCWKFTPTSPKGKRWEFVANSQDYLYKVVKAIEGGW